LIIFEEGEDDIEYNSKTINRPARHKRYCFVIIDMIPKMMLIQNQRCQAIIVQTVLFDALHDHDEFNTENEVHHL